MTNIHEESEVLSAYADGEVTDDVAVRIEAHLASCPACGEVLESFRGTKLALSGAARRQMPLDLRSRLERRFTPVPWRSRLAAFLSRPLVWAPAGVLTAVTAALLLMEPAVPRTIPMEVLLASHARYQGESLAPRADFHHAYFTAHVAAEADED